MAFLFFFGREEGNANSYQYSCLENRTDSGAWWAMLHGVPESNMTERLHTHTGDNRQLAKLTLLYIDMNKIKQGNGKGVWRGGQVSLE